MEEILINWIRKNPAFAEDSDDSYHNRKQMMEFAKHYHKKQLLLHNVVGQSEQYCDCDKPTLGDNVWTCGCGKPFKRKDK